MKALVLKAPGMLEYEPDWHEPEVPEGWVLVKVGASGICGSDLPRMMQMGAYHYPIIPGHEFAGVVAESRSPTVKAGDRVAVMPIIPCRLCDGCETGPFHCWSYDFVGSRRDGGFAEFCAVPAENVFVLPDNVSVIEGAFIEPLSVTLHVLRRSGMRPGARALIFGGGTIGILTAQWAHVLGAREVFLADVREESLGIAESCGIERVVNPLSVRFSGLAEFDNVFEAAGSSAALVAGIGKAAAKGCLVVVGRDVKDTVIPLKDFETLMRRELDVRGCWGYDNRSQDDFIYECLKARKFALAPMVTHRLPMEEGPEMIRRMWNKETFYCKVLFSVE